jgi:hypothetical protein
VPSSSSSAIGTTGTIASAQQARQASSAAAVNAVPSVFSNATKPAAKGAGAGGVVSPTREAAIRGAVAQYELALQRSGAPQPWLLVEQLGDEILEEVLTQCAQGLFNAAGDAVESLAASECSVAPP